MPWLVIILFRIEGASLLPFQSFHLPSSHGFKKGCVVIALFLRDFVLIKAICFFVRRCFRIVVVFSFGGGADFAVDVVVVVTLSVAVIIIAEAVVVGTAVFAFCFFLFLLFVVVVVGSVQGGKVDGVY